MLRFSSWKVALVLGICLLGLVYSLPNLFPRAQMERMPEWLPHDGKMDSGTFAKAAQLFGKKGAMDLVAVMSTYAVSGFYAIAVDEHMPPGRQDLESAPRQ